MTRSDRPGAAVLTEDIGAITVITINRPGTRNAVDAEVAVGLDAALDRLEQDDRLQVAVITGAGGDFSTGMNLKAYLDSGIPVIGDRGFAGIARRSLTKPVIAAVEGYALAGGFEIALACDLIVAARGARFGLPEVGVGLVAAAGGLVRLPRRLPFHLAMLLALTGRTLSASDAHHHGLVAELCEDGAARDRAVELAREIAAKAPLAVRASKRIVVESENLTLNEAFVRQTDIIEPVFTSADAREGAIAFLERRPANWSGS
jgi:enoyl-CoA hydratase